MIEKAIGKVKKEIGELKSPYSKILGEYIINTLLTNTENAERVLKEKKTLKDCLSAITEKARGQKVNNCAVIEDKTVYTWLREYYGVNNVTEAKAENKTADDGLNISLLDLL